MSAEAAAGPWPQRVLAFWFEELTPREWFTKSDELDRRIADNFTTLVEDLSARPGDDLLTTQDAALASVIVLDQFTRNIYRNQPQAFASDAKALEIAHGAIAKGYDQGLPAERRVFLYLPFEHSENMADQDRSVELISALGDDNYTRYAIAHRDIVARFGRFPHRNTILGRTSTPEELEFLAQPGSSF